MVLQEGDYWEQMRREALPAEQKEQKLEVHIENEGKTLRITDARSKFQTLLLNTIRLESKSHEELIPIFSGESG